MGAIACNNSGETEEVEDSGQKVQGIQPNNSNNGKAQMFVILLASMCIASILSGKINNFALSREMANIKNWFCVPTWQATALMDDKSLMEDLWAVYYGNKDLKLLLNLLAESSGLASSLR